MNVSRDVCFLFAEHDIESSGISTTLRFSMDFSGLLGLCAKATKGTAKKARTINANTFFIIHFLLLIITLEAPPGFLV
jgi:hypothetical protein